MLLVAATLVAGCAFAWTGPGGAGKRGGAEAGAGGTTAAQSSKVKARPRPGATGLRIDGEVAVPGTAGAAAMLSVRIGDTTTEVPVTLPAFSVQLPAQQADPMVSLEVTLAGAKYTAVLGGYDRIARKAGADAVLEPAELDRVRITAMGTSLHHYVSRVLGGRLPVSDRELEQAIRAVGMDVAVGGWVLHAIASGALALPAGYPDGYALLQDASGLRAFLAGVPEYTQEVQAFARQPSGIPFPLLALDADTAVLSTLEYGETKMASATPRVLLRRDGGFEFHGRSTTDPVATVTALDTGAVRVTPREPARFHAFPLVTLVPGEPPTQVLAMYEPLHETWRRHFVGDRYSLWAVTETFRVSYPQNPELAPTELVVTRMSHAFALHKLAPRFRAADLMDRRVLPYFCAAPDGHGLEVLWDCEYGQTTFIRDGSGLVQEIGSKVDAQMQPRVAGYYTEFFQWTLGARGTLRMTFPRTEVTYWRLEGGDASVTPVLYVARGQGASGTNLTYAGTSVLIDSRSDVEFDEELVPGRWKYGTFRQGENDDAWQAAPTETTFVRDAQGRTAQVTHFAEGDFPPQTMPSSWQLIDIEIYFQPYARLYESRYRGDNSRIYATCEDAYADGATDCIPNAVRYFRPMARLGDRIYGIEDLYQNTGWFGGPVTVQRYSRPTYHERVEAAGSPAALPLPRGKMRARAR